MTVVGSVEAGFEPTLATRIGSTIATSFIDTEAFAGAFARYHVIAVDQSGNPVERR